MSDYLKTYSIRVKFIDEMRYGQQITAPDEETALKLFIEEYLNVNFVQEEKWKATWNSTGVVSKHHRKRILSSSIGHAFNI